jgi:Plasmid pRiA4b ORF-3-like protein
MEKKSAKMEHEVCQLKVTLLDSRPLIWRRLLVPADLTLPRLHKVLQIAMGWQNSHVYEFHVEGRRPAGRGSAPMGRNARIGDVLTETGSSLIYTYDLGDGWEHDIVLEKRSSGGEDAASPVCVDGEQACPPEDCGGVSGYSDLLEILQNPADERYEEMREWIGETFDPRAFSVEVVNRQLKSRVRSDIRG